VRRLALIAAIILVPAVAFARSEKTIDYAATKVWPTAVRFLRVDEGCKIIEKDADAGYVLFELVDEGKTYQGALELVNADDDSGPRVRLVMTIEDRPSYVESMMLDRLERKVRADLGSAPVRKPKPADPPKKPDPPADKPKDDGKTDDKQPPADKPKV
jgi:hypothetical protein